MKGNIYINGLIGKWDGEPCVQLTDVIKQVKSQPRATAYNVYINSEGGFVDTGFDIYNYLKSLNKPITTIGNGIVASIATVIFMAGTNRIIKQGTQFMVHLPWGEGAGNADDMEQYALELRSYEKQLLGFYTKALHIEQQAIMPLLRDETWLTPEQLTTLGFTTSNPFKIAAKARINIKPNNMNYNRFSEEDKSWVKGVFGDIFGKFKSRPYAKIVQDATGTEIDFPDLSDDDVITEGAAATIEGKPANGKYTMPDEQVYVFKNGELTEIIPGEGTDEVETLIAENNALRNKLAALNLAKASAENARAQAQGKILNLKKDVERLKSEIYSKFDIDNKKDGKKKLESNDRVAGIQNYINKKRKR